MEVRVVDERRPADGVDPARRVAKGLPRSRRGLAVHERAAAERVHVDRGGSAAARDLLARDEHEVGRLHVGQLLRVDEGLVVGDGEELVAVVAVPEGDGARRGVSIAAQGVGVHVAALEVVDVDRLHERARGPSVSRGSVRTAARTRPGARPGAQREGQGSAPGARVTEGKTCAHRLLPNDRYGLLFPNLKATPRAFAWSGARSAGVECARLEPPSRPPASTRAVGAAVLVAAALAVPGTYAVLRTLQVLFGGPEPNPATIVWSPHIAMFWRLAIGAYVAGMASPLVYFAARKDLARTVRGLGVAATAVAVVALAQGLLLP